MKIQITYDGKQDDELDSRLVGLLEFPPFNYEWVGQGYNFKTKKRDITFISPEKEQLCQRNHRRSLLI